MQKTKSAGLVLSVILSLGAGVGCAVESGTTDEVSGPVAGAETDPSILATVDVGYGTVTFHEFVEADGTTTIAIGEQIPNTFGATPLAATAANHTNLEIFLALVPGQEPPASFVAAHAGQAQALGRESDDVVDAVFDRDAPIEKTSTTCKNWVTPPSDVCYNYTYSSVHEAEDQVGQQYLLAGTTNQPIYLGICNDGPYAVQGRIRWAPAGTNTYTNPGWTPNVNPGAGWVWHGAYVNLSGSECPPAPDLCIGYKNVKWRVEGKSTTTNSTNKYDLRSGIRSGYSERPGAPSSCIVK